MVNTFISFMQSLLGSYTPVTDYSGAIPPGLAGCDWPYIVRALVFCIVLYSLFRTLGGMLCKM